MDRVSPISNAQVAFPKGSALFFDLDGTLADSEKLHWQAWHQTLARYDVDFTWRQYEENVIGFTDESILLYCQAAFPEVEELSERTKMLKQDEFFRLLDEVSPFSGETIACIQSIAHIPLALVTSSTRKEAMAMLEKASLLQCFAVIVCLDDVSEPKPSPGPYLQAMTRLAVTKGTAFEDSDVGMMSARSAGLDVVRVDHPAKLPALVREKIAMMTMQNR